MPFDLSRPRSSWFKKSSLVVVLTVFACSIAAMYGTTVAVKSRELKVVRAEGRGKPFFNFRNGQEMSVAYRGMERGTQALQSGDARARSLATADLDNNGTPDLIAGYVSNGTGIITVQRGNPEAYVPTEEVLASVQQGYNPDALLPGAEVYDVPVPVDFLAVGNFDDDSQKDVLVAAQGGGLYLLAGAGGGQLNAPQQIGLPGSVTVMAAGEFAAADGRTDVAVGISGTNGSSLIVFDSTKGKFEPSNLEVPLSGPATAVQFGELDSDPFMDVAVVSGTELKILHGAGRKNSPVLAARIEQLNLDYDARGLMIGNFTWDRETRHEIAILAGDGSVHILERGALKTTPFSAQEIAERAQMRRRQARTAVDVDTVSGWKLDQAGEWHDAKTADASAAIDSDLLLKAHISWRDTDDLLVAGEGKLNIVHPIAATEKSLPNVPSTANDLTLVALDLVSAPVDAVALPVKINGERPLVLMDRGGVLPTLIPLATTAVISVDRFDDPNGAALPAASVCSAAPNDCSLRGAVQFANLPINAGSTINIGTGTVTLNTNGAGGCTIESAATGNTIGDLEINQSTTIIGNGSTNTIVRQLGNGGGGFVGDRVMCLNVPFTTALNYTFTGFTVTGGRDGGTNIGAGGIIGGEKDNLHVFTDLRVSNNQSTGAVLTGGGIQITGGSLTLNNCLIGGPSDPGANRSDVTLANSVSTSGGGVGYSSGSPTGITPSSGTFTSNNNTSYQRNRAASVSAGGGGADLFTHNLGTGSANITNSTFANNAATVANGGAFILESTLVTTVSATTFTNNSAANIGGAVYTGGGSLLLDGTAPTITFSGNSAPTGSSIGVSAQTNVSGTNVVIGGDAYVGTGGVWTNNVGSSLSPTNFIVDGGTFNGNNSTMNIGGNLQIEPGAVVGGIFNANSGTYNLSGNFTFMTGGGPASAFNAGTSTFNFIGGAAQSINGPGTPNFNNFVVNKTAGTILTLNTNTPIIGALTVSAGILNLSTFNANRTAAGGTLTVSNGATLRIGGTGTVPSNFSTHAIGATSTIEYNGTNQNVVPLNSSQRYGNLIIGGSLTKTLTNAILVATNLTLAAATLDVTAGNFGITNGGNWTNNGGTFNPRAGTVTFDGASNPQTIGGSAATQTFFTINNNKTSNSTAVGGSTTTLNLNGNMILTSGTFNAGTATAINVTGNWTNNGGTFTGGTGTVVFNNTAGAQAINGTNTTQSFNSITVAKTAQTLSVGGSTATLNLSGTMLLTSGTFAAGTASNINIAGGWTNNGGTFSAGTGTVTFNGSAIQTIGGTTATTFNNLTVGNAAGLSMTFDNTVNGALALNSGDITVAAPRILTQPNTGTSSGTFDVVGNLRRTGFVTAACALAPCANTLSFGNPDNQITVTAGTSPANILVNMQKSSPVGFSQSVQRNYTITPNGGSGITATVRLHYRDTELNGNVPETSLNLRRFNGVGWAPYAPTRPVDTVNNWVESNAVQTFSQWTLSTFIPTATNGIISGRLTTSDGTPVVGAVIRLEGTQTRRTITDANGNYRFDNVETNGLYTVTPARANYVFAPSMRALSQLGIHTEAEFTGSVLGDSFNPLETAEYFVRQQYVDVLNREPDEGGFTYWSDRIVECGSDAACITARRRDVAAAFFIEGEFQRTGSFIYGLYKGALGRRPNYSEYSTDRPLIVEGPNLEAMKQAFAEGFVSRAEFLTRYQTAVTADSFVDALLRNVLQASGVDLSSERSLLVARYSSGVNLNQSRSLALRALIDRAAFKDAEYNGAFVLTEYFGYLRRDPDGGGYAFWLNVLDNREPGNYRGMVCAFITAAEYQQRFSANVSRTNFECGQ
jgi:hypothetical protein